ncbi:MAG: 4-hydroxy-tetrahydrodipicolinate synthase, partial [Alphaproteobacteria bacterium]
MTELRSSLHGLWLPLITPFRDGALDEASLRELVRHYLSLPIRGLILAATTGEGLTLDPHETERLVFAVRDEARKLNNLPICLGLAGSSTAVLLEMLAKTAVW